MIEQLAFSAFVDTGEQLEMTVTRRDGADRLTIAAGLFTLSFPVDDAPLIIGAIARAIDEDRTKRGDVCVVEIGDEPVDVGFGLSVDGHSVWINCAPFHLRLPVFAARYLIGTLSEARRQWREEKTVLGATAVQRMAS